MTGPFDEGENTLTPGGCAKAVGWAVMLWLIAIAIGVLVWLVLR